MLISDEEKLKKLEKISERVRDSELSSIRNVTSGIVKIINDSKSNARDLKAIIEIDPPLTAKVLRTANSAYYYSRRQISDIEEAVIWIGFDNLKEIALSQKVCEIFQKNDDFMEYSRTRLWKHCIAVGLLAKMIYRMEFGESGENIYAAGLLHDIGIIVEDQFYEEEFKQVLHDYQIDKSTLHTAESKFWGYDHADIGQAVASSWQLPEDLMISIGFHHNFEEVPPDYMRMATTLALADNLCHESGFGYRKFFVQKGLTRRLLDILEIKKYAMDMIMDGMKKEIKRMEGQGIL
ncbi:MAG: hypothetical protein A2020_08780 [Lentisphaerae bacterium GWF2_45_14]|nr:MAG: hypothetical protein A2020_08780 [Lentisphaerae bacterium GWF2_45_14]